MLRMMSTGTSRGAGASGIVPGGGQGAALADSAVKTGAQRAPASRNAQMIGDFRCKTYLRGCKGKAWSLRDLPANSTQFLTGVLFA